MNGVPPYLIPLLPAAAVSVTLCALAAAGAAALAARRASLLPLDRPEYQEFAASLDGAVALISADLERVLYASPGFEPLFGSAPDRVSFRRLEGVVHAEDLEALESALSAGRLGPFEVEFRILSGKDSRWLRMRGFPVAGSGRKAARRIAVWVEDRSLRKTDELRLVEALDYEVAVGARIQQALLLGSPERAYPGFDLASMTLPSQKIDGDFMDFFDGCSEVLDLMLGDVMGKGVPAALTGAAACNAFFRARLALAERAGSALPPVKDIVRGAEERIAGKLMDLRTFFTLVYGRLDGKRGLYRYVDCGHTSVLHFERRTGRCWRLKGANAPVGFMPEQDYVEYAVPLSPGDLLFLYSDGITEDENSEGERFGEERLMKLVGAHSGLDAAALLDKVKHIAFAYAGGGSRTTSRPWRCASLPVRPSGPRAAGSRSPWNPSGRYGTSTAPARAGPCRIPFPPRTWTPCSSRPARPPPTSSGTAPRTDPPTVRRPSGCPTPGPPFTSTIGGRITNGRSRPLRPSRTSPRGATASTSSTRPWIP